MAILSKMCSPELGKKSMKKKEKKNPFLNIIFHPFAVRTLLGRFVSFWQVGSHRRRNHPSQILSRLIQGLGGYMCPKSRVSH